MSYSSYYDSAEGIRLTPREVANLLGRHGVIVVEGLEGLDEEAPADERGERDAQQVLDWLGY